MRVLKCIFTAAEALEIAKGAEGPKPSADDVCERIHAYAKNGRKCLVYPTKLPIETVDALRLRGFEVKTGEIGTSIDWTQGRGAIPPDVSPAAEALVGEMVAGSIGD